MAGYGTEATSILPLPGEGHGSRDYWKKEIEASIEQLTVRKAEWDRNLNSYLAKTLASVNGVDQVVVPRDFGMVEQKGAQLFFQTPEIHLKTQLDPIADAITVFQPILNYYLGEDEVNALAMMNETLFDALCPAGIMCSKIGYEVFTDGTSDQPTGNQIPDPEFQPMDALPGSVLGIGTPPPEAPMIPELKPAPNIIHERYFWNRFSPARVLIPWSFHGSVYDRAPWLGERCDDDWEVLAKKYSLTIDKPRSKGTKPEDLLIGSQKVPSSRVSDRIQYTEIWYRACLFDPMVKHPEKIRQLVLMDGVDEPLIHRDSPYQTTSGLGRLIGMMGYPIHIGALRYVSDTAYPPSEVSIARATNEELNKSRTQMMLQRDRSIPMRYADAGRLGGPAGVQKLRDNIYQQIIELATFDANNPPVGVMALAQYPRENFTFNDYLDRDLDQIWAMGANQRGSESDKSLTATEISKIDQWATTRLDKERRQALTYFIRGTRKLGSLLQMFVTSPQAAEIVGPEQAKRLEAWDRQTIPNAVAYSANPDSAIRIDQAQARTQVLKIYELLAKDPNIRRTELLIEVCRAWNYDPTRLVVEELPPKGPEPITASVALKPEFIDVSNPNFPIYLAMLKAAGYHMLEEPVQGVDENGQPTVEPSPVDQAMAVMKFQQQVMGMAEGGTSPEDPSGTGAGMPGPGGSTPGGGGAQPVQPGSVPPGVRQQDHPGTASKAERLSKHAGDQSGERSGPKIK